MTLSIFKQKKKPSTSGGLGLSSLGLRDTASDIPEGLASRHEGSAVAEQVSVVAKQLLLNLFQIPGFLRRRFALVAVGQERKERIEGCVEKEQQGTNHGELLVTPEKILT